jgi:RNA polymerase sigma-70 factor (ECF subfamily)
MNNNLEDMNLVRAFTNSQDKQALDDIYQKYGHDILRFCYARCQDTELAKDLVQDTFETFMAVASHYDGSAKLSTFIFGIALNKLRQHWDRKKITRNYELDIDVSELDIAESDTIRYIDKTENLRQMLPHVLAGLNDNYRQILNLRFSENKSIKETADILGISVTNVTTTQNRALKQAILIANTLISK